MKGFLYNFLMYTDGCDLIPSVISHWSLFCNEGELKEVYLRRHIDAEPSILHEMQQYDSLSVSL